MAIVKARSLTQNLPLKELVIDNVRGKTIWVPARPMNYMCDTLKSRLKQAWMVLTGKADTLVWD